MEYVLVAVAGLAVLIGTTAFSRRTGVAAPLLLVGLGVGASYLPWFRHVEVAPEVVLAGVLPPLLYASSVRLPVLDFRRNLRMISWLSVVVVLASALLVGSVVHLLFPQIPLAVGIALGAVVSPTDAVAATAIGRRLGLPPRLMTVLEGESLVNDATALVLLRSALAAVAGSFALWQAALEFLLAVLVAVLVGALVGWGTSWLRTRLDDPVLTSCVSFVVPFLAYFPAEELHGSGVLAVVVAGLVTGFLGTRRFTARDRQTEATNWAVVSFLLESALFLAMGLQLPGLLAAARADGTLGTVGLLAVLVLALLVLGRAVGVGLPMLGERIGPGRVARTRQQLAELDARLDDVPVVDERDRAKVEALRRRLMRGHADVDFLENEPITSWGALVLAWSGMRGAVTVAAAQTIPQDVPFRSVVVLAAFVVAVAALVLFGGTLPWVIRRADFPEAPAEDRRAELAQLLRSVTDTAVDRLGPLERQTVEGEPVDPQVAELLARRFAPLLAGRAEDRGPGRPGLREQVVVLQRRYLDAMREALNEERSIGVYRTETFAHAQAILDRQERGLDAVS